MVRIELSAPDEAQPTDIAIRPNDAAIDLMHTLILRIPCLRDCLKEPGAIVRVYGRKETGIRPKNFWWSAEQHLRARRNRALLSRRVPLPGDHVSGGNRTRKPLLTLP